MASIHNAEFSKRFFLFFLSRYNEALAHVDFSRENATDR